MPTPDDHLYETVIPSQDWIKMRVASDGRLFIEQDASGKDSPDTIIVARQNVDAFMSAIRRLCGK